MGRLDEAIRAHKAAQAGVERAKEKADELIKAARDRAETARRELHAAIVEETLAGTPQKALVDRTGLSRETVRQVQRRAGIEPAE